MQSRRKHPRHRHRRKDSRKWAAVVLVTCTAAAVPAAAMAAMAAPGNGNPGGQLAGLTAKPDCTLTVPASPFSAQGLATPYVLGSAGQACSEGSEGLAAFVQATIIDPATGRLWVYNPVVRDAGQQLLGSPPPVPALPPGADVTIWTGFNGNVLKLTGPGAGSFTNFAQQSYAGSAGFFHKLREAIASGKTRVPALGTAKDGMACPSTRDFSVVDQDQSDNVPVSYPAYGVSNGSDEGLLAGFIYPALGCQDWQVPSLSSPGAMSPSGALQEAMAAADQKAPVALVPALDPFVLSGGQPSSYLQNLYRQQVDQPRTGNGNDTRQYCVNLALAGEPRLKLDAQFETGPAPQFAQIGANLSLVLAARFAATWQNLTCQQLTGMASPITVTTEAGVAVSAVYTSQPAPAPTPTPTATVVSTPTPKATGAVTVFACERPGGALDHVQAGTAPACPAGETPLNWQAQAG